MNDGPHGLHLILQQLQVAPHQVLSATIVLNNTLNASQVRYHRLDVANDFARHGPGLCFASARFLPPVVSHGSVNRTSRLDESRRRRVARTSLSLGDRGVSLPCTIGVVLPLLDRIEEALVFLSCVGNLFVVSSAGKHFVCVLLHFRQEPRSGITTASELVDRLSLALPMSYTPGSDFTLFRPGGSPAFTRGIRQGRPQGRPQKALALGKTFWRQV